MVPLPIGILDLPEQTAGVPIADSQYGADIFRIDRKSVFRHNVVNSCSQLLQRVKRWFPDRAKIPSVTPTVR